MSTITQRLNGVKPCKERGLQQATSDGDGHTTAPLAGLVALQGTGGDRSRPVPAVGGVGGKAPHGLVPPAGEQAACQYKNKGTLPYVKACAERSWSIVSWLKPDPKKPSQLPPERHKRPFRCHSWRHDGDCARWKAAQDFARSKEAFKGRSNLIYIVLTLDPSRWKNEWAAYRGGFFCWKRLALRLKRRYGGGIEYMMTVERHKSGFPHFNLVIDNAPMKDALDMNIHAVERELKDAAVSCGFGWKVYVEPLRDADAMAGYLTKLASELVKTSQIPTNAPRHFRRIRSSRGFLPKVFAHDPKWTGTIVFHPVIDISLDNDRGIGYHPIHEGFKRKHDVSTVRPVVIARMVEEDTG